MIYFSFVFQTLVLPTSASVAGFSDPHRRSDSNISSNSYLANQYGVVDSSSLSISRVLDTSEAIFLSGDTHEPQFGNNLASTSRGNGRLPNRRKTLPAQLPRYVTASVSGLVFRCNACNKEYPNLSMLQTHQHVHTHGQPFSCSFCDKRFSDAYNCRIHERLHTGYRPHVCGICKKGFNRAAQLRQHQKYHARSVRIVKI